MHGTHVAHNLYSRTFVNKLSNKYLILKKIALFLVI